MPCPVTDVQQPPGRAAGSARGRCRAALAGPRRDRLQHHHWLPAFRDRLISPEQTALLQHNIPVSRRWSAPAITLDTPPHHARAVMLICANAGARPFGIRVADAAIAGRCSIPVACIRASRKRLAQAPAAICSAYYMALVLIGLGEASTAVSIDRRRRLSLGRLQTR